MTDTPSPRSLPADGRLPGEARQDVRRRQPPREVVRSIRCPQCQALPGQPCQGRRGVRKSNHMARVELATELRYGQTLQLPRVAPTSLPDGRNGGAVTRRAGRRPERAALDSPGVQATLHDVGGAAAASASLR